MADLPDQLRAWVDAAVVDVDPVTVEEVRARPPRADRSRSLAWPAAAVLVVVAIAAGLALAPLLAGDGERERTATDPGDGTDVAFTVLGRSEGSSRAPGQLQSVTGPEGLAALWSAAGVGKPVPAVDLATQAVVGITIGDDLCPPTLVRFARDGPELTPVFREPEGACRQPEVARTFVVALDRATTGPSFRLVLPDRSVEGEGALVLDVGGPVDRSSPEVAVRSFVTSVVGAADARRAEVTVAPGAPAEGPVAVDVVLDDARSRVRVAPTPDGWVVAGAGDEGLAVDGGRVRIPPVDGATTVAVSVVTDLGATVTVERTTTGPTGLDLPPGPVRTVTTVHRALDGRILALGASAPGG